MILTHTVWQKMYSTSWSHCTHLKLRMIQNSASQKVTDLRFWTDHHQIQNGSRQETRWDKWVWYLPITCLSSVNFSLKMLDPKTVKHQIFPALMEPLELQIMATAAMRMFAANLGILGQLVGRIVTF